MSSSIETEYTQQNFNASQKKNTTDNKQAWLKQWEEELQLDKHANPVKQESVTVTVEPLQQITDSQLMGLDSFMQQALVPAAVAIDQGREAVPKSKGVVAAEKVMDFVFEVKAGDGYQKVSNLRQVSQATNKTLLRSSVLSETGYEVSIINMMLTKSEKLSGKVILWIRDYRDISPEKIAEHVEKMVAALREQGVDVAEVRWNAEAMENINNSVKNNQGE